MHTSDLVLLLIKILSAETEVWSLHTDTEMEKGV